MRGLLRDTALFLSCVLVPCGAGFWLERTSTWTETEYLGAGLFVIATLMVFTGLRLLTEPGPGPKAASAGPRQPRWAESCPAGVPDYLLGGGPLDAPIPTCGRGGPEDDPYLLEPRLSQPIRSRSEIIHVERKEGSARVVALLRTGEEAEEVHLLELDVTGEDLRIEVIAEAVAEVASGEPESDHAPVDRIGYASGWGLTIPCPPLSH